MSEHAPGDVTVLRAAIRDVPAIDWTQSDDLSRFTTDVLDRLPDNTRIVTVPPDTHLVLISDPLLDALAGAGRAEWGEVKPGGWYEPTIYADPRIENQRRENDVLIAELAESKAHFELVWKSDMRAIARWQDAHPERMAESPGGMWPDRTDLVVWLMEQDQRMLEAIKDHVETGCITGHTGGNLAALLAERSTGATDAPAS